MEHQLEQPPTTYLKKRFTTQEDAPDKYVINRSRRQFTIHYRGYLTLLIGHFITHFYCNGSIVTLVGGNFDSIKYNRGFNNTNISILLPKYQKIVLKYVL